MTTGYDYTLILAGIILALCLWAWRKENAIIREQEREQRRRHLTDGRERTLRALEEDE